jgi:hypothetical protein
LAVLYTRSNWDLQLGVLHNRFAMVTLQQAPPEPGINRTKNNLVIVKKKIIQPLF